MALISMSVAQRHQLMLQHRVYGASASHGVPVYALAFTRDVNPWPWP